MSVLRWGEPAEVLAAVPATMPELRVPTLIFQGSRDRVVPDEFAQRASAFIPRSRVVVVDSGHFIPLNNPESVAAELLLFFQAPTDTTERPCLPEQRPRPIAVAETLASIPAS